MGSFDYTCSVSGLPISEGEPVRFLILTENPFYRPAGMTCEMGDIWSPRCFPLKAVYNDYGSVEEIQEGFCLNLWFNGLQKDLVEQGTGDNVCHDIATDRDMGMDTFLSALQEGRLKVQMLESAALR